MQEKIEKKEKQARPVKERGQPRSFYLTESVGGEYNIINLKKDGEMRGKTEDDGSSRNERRCRQFCGGIVAERAGIRCDRTVHGELGRRRRKRVLYGGSGL